MLTAPLPGPFHRLGYCLFSRRKLICVLTIPKCGQTSVETTLSNYDDFCITNYFEIQHLQPYVVVLLRDPIARFMSGYAEVVYRQDCYQEHPTGVTFHTVTGCSEKVDAFLRDIQSLGFFDEHICPQSSFLKGIAVKEFIVLCQHEERWQQLFGVSLAVSNTRQQRVEKTFLPIVPTVQQAQQIEALYSEDIKLLSQIKGDGLSIRTFQNMGLYPFNGDPVCELEMHRILTQYPCTIAIETGTEYGRTTEFLALHFGQVHTMEIVEKSFEKAKEKIGGLSNVSMHLGCSTDLLRELLPQIELQGPTDHLFCYLDAHWEDYWPLLDEIKILGKHFKDKCVIVIDDFKVPNRDLQFDCGRDGKPNDYGFVQEALAAAFTEPYYYYNSRASQPGGKRGVGKLYVLPHPPPDEHNWVTVENGNRYSTL